MMTCRYAHDHGLCPREEPDIYLCPYYSYVPYPCDGSPPDFYCEMLDDAVPEPDLDDLNRGLDS